MLIRDEKFSTRTDAEYYAFYQQDNYSGHFYITHEKNCLSIWDVRIFEQYRNKGLGKQMMEECLELIRGVYSEYSSAILFVESNNIPAVKLYTSVGFKEIADNFRGIKKMEILL